MTSTKHPTRITYDDVHPELREGVRQLPKLRVNNRLKLSVARFMMGLVERRRAVLPGGIEMSCIQRGKLQHRLFRPSAGGNDAAVVWIHGGGLVMGSARGMDEFCGQLADRLGVTVLSVDYRLAPEHPFPAANDDCVDAWRWLQDNAVGLGVDPSRIAVGGHSAGGGLAAALCQRLRDEGGVQPVAQCLVYPMLDDRTAADKALDACAHILWDNTMNRFGWSAYLAQPAGDAATPAWSVPARCEDLTGLPPAWVGVGTLDLFCEENRRYVDTLQAAGVPYELEVVEGAPHAFEMASPESAVTVSFVQAIHQFLQNQLTPMNT